MLYRHFVRSLMYSSCIRQGYLVVYFIQVDTFWYFCCAFVKRSSIILFIAATATHALDATYCSYSKVSHILKRLTTCCFIAWKLSWRDFVSAGALRIQQYSYGLCVLIPLSVPSPYIMLGVLSFLVNMLVHLTARNLKYCAFVPGTRPKVYCSCA